MNRQQMEQVSSLIDVFYSLDFKLLIAEQYKNRGAYSEIMIGDINLDDYIVMVGKVYEHFKQEFVSDNFLTLPFNYNFPDLGSGNVNSDLNSLNSCIKNSQFDNSLSYLIKLATYQRVYGFWEYNLRKVIKASERKIQNDNEILEAKKKLIDVRISEIESLIKSIDSEREKIGVFNDESINKIKFLESSLQNILVQNDSVNNLHNNAATTVEKINSQLALADSKRNELDKLYDKASGELVDINENITEYKAAYNTWLKTFESLNKDFTEKLEFVESKHEYFDERNNYLNDLIGREVGASLFETFKQRKNELSPSVRFWKWAVPFLAAATVGWIFLLFDWSSSQQMTYQLLIINSIKALPAIGLLLFGISQYGKERNFQEEYAFKSAVALTLNSYAEQLKNEDNKDALILASVSSIYRSPIYHSKIKMEDSKEVIGTVSDLLGKIKDLNPLKK